MKIVMTLLVRDEIDIVRDNILFHLERGVDHVVATDNGSTDGTREVLAEFERMGILTLIDEPEQNKLQSKWVTRMALLARDRLGADWIVNNDADEFWLPPTGDLKQALRDSDVDLLACRRQNLFYAYDRDTASAWHEKVIYRIAAPKPLPKLDNPISDPMPFPYYYYGLPGKALTRAAGLKRVGQGNHSAVYDHQPSETVSAITVYHFPFRSNAQLERKVVQGGLAHESNLDLPPTRGWHVRRWLRLTREKGIEAALADALPGLERLERDLETGLVIRDSAISDVLKKGFTPTM